MSIEELEKQIKELEKENAILKQKWAATSSMEDTVKEMKDPSLLMLDFSLLNKMRSEAGQYIQMMERKHSGSPVTNKLGDESFYESVCQELYELISSLNLDKREYERVMANDSAEYAHWKVLQED